METSKIIGAFAQLGKVMFHLGRGDAWPGESVGLTRQEYDQMDLVITTEKLTNGWFTEESKSAAAALLAAATRK